MSGVNCQRMRFKKANSKGRRLKAQAWCKESEVRQKSRYQGCIGRLEGRAEALGEWFRRTEGKVAKGCGHGEAQ